MQLSLVPQTQIDGASAASLAGVEPAIADCDIPLVLDLDGTLIRANILHEQALAFVRARTLNLFLLAGWLWQGKAVLKRRLSQAVSVDPSYIPVNPELADYAKTEANRNRKVYIATGCDELAALPFGERFDFVSGIIASDGVENLKGAAKAGMLARLFPNGFDYAGNERADIYVWKRARRAIVVEASAPVQRAAAQVAEVAATFARPSRLAALVESLRLHQWAKNLLVFVPIVLSGGLGDATALGMTLLAFLAMGFVASSTYIVNDCLDIASDRRHWTKKSRPVASGRLPLIDALAGAAIILFLGLVVAASAGPGVFSVVFVYLCVTLAYSLGLKRVPVLDAFVLALLFTLRLGLGIVACGAPPSPWLLVFSMFLFGSLSFAKRHTEIARVIERNADEVIGRGYQPRDLPLVSALGIATGTGGVLIMVLYIVEDAFRQSFYGNTAWLWGFPIALFLFMSRIWLVCQRGELNDDPVVFAVKDPMSLALGGFMLLCFLLAWQWPLP